MLDRQVHLKGSRRQREGGAKQIPCTIQYSVQFQNQVQQRLLRLWQRIKQSQTNFLNESCDHVDDSFWSAAMNRYEASVCLLIIITRQRRSENRKQVQFLPLWPWQHHGEDQLGRRSRSRECSETLRMFFFFFLHFYILFAAFVCVSRKYLYIYILTAVSLMH